MSGLESKEDSFYENLFSKWREENDKKQLNPLPQDYYQKIAEHIGRNKRLLKELDQKSTRAVLLNEELQQTKKIARNLVTARRCKILQMVSQGETIPAEDLTVEDERLYTSILSAINEYYEKTNLSQEERVEDKKGADERGTPKRILVRFLREIPAIIGSDMRTYGPFKTEDIATLPAENAMALVRQGFAVEVRVQDDNP
jgi:DNA replication factor GINS